VQCRKGQAKIIGQKRMEKGIRGKRQTKNKQDFGLCTFGLNEKKVEIEHGIKNLQERTQSEKPNEEGRRKTSILRCLWFTVMLTALLNGTVEHPGSEERGSFAVEVLENRFHFV